MKLSIIITLLLSLLLNLNANEEDKKHFFNLYKQQNMKEINEISLLLRNINQEVINDRKILLQKEIVFSETLMNDLIKKYKIINWNNQKEIKRKVSPLNINLILAHIIYETNYLKNKDSKYFNYFNTWTTSKKYKKIKNTLKYGIYGKIKYKSKKESLEHYYMILNTSKIGKKFRYLREKGFSSLNLLNGLDSFYNNKKDIKGIEDILKNVFLIKKEYYNNPTLSNRYIDLVMFKNEDKKREIDNKLKDNESIKDMLKRKGYNITN